MIGKCNETKSNIIFLFDKGKYLSFDKSVVIIEPKAYVVCRFHRDKIDSVSFSCPELNYIHPISKAYSLNLDIDEFANKGVVGVTTQEFNDSTTEKQIFLIDDKEVSVCFSVYITIGSKIHEPPLSLKTTMLFEFEATDDYYFVFQLWFVARNFIRFLCYRKNIFISEIELAAPYENGKHENFATMHLIKQQGETEEEPLKGGRYIKQIHIAGKEGQILSDIADNKLYLRHLPESYFSGRHFDAARFIMIVTAFEWEFKRLYPDGISKSNTTINAENEIIEEIQNKINECKGKKKSIYKFLSKRVRNDSLQSKIVQVGKDYSGIIDVFGNQLFHLNSEKLIYSDMGQRLSDQRNRFAHGDLDKDFVDLSLLDLMFLELIVYALQLKYYDIPDKEIQKSINELFHRGFAM